MDLRSAQMGKEYIISAINTDDELALMEGAGTEVAAVFAITKVAALAYLMFNLYTPPASLHWVQ